MSQESEMLGLASIGAVSPGGKADLSGQPCRNCGEMVEQRHCPRCGQLAASYHRPFYALITESVSDSMALDGRIARSMPLLFFRPGVLTRRYTEGKRARYVPPFRLFLLSSLLFYFVVFAFLGQVNWLDFATANVDGEQLSDQDMQELRDAFVGEDGQVDNARLQAFLRGLEDAAAEGETVPGITEPASDGETGDEAPAPPDETGEGDEADPDSAPAERPEIVTPIPEMEERVQRIIDNPQLFVSALELWLPRLSLLLVPFTMLAMSLMYFWRRKVFVYDHAIHALNLHSWIYLAATFAMLVGLVIGAGTASALFFLALPVYVTLSLRGAYRSGIISSFFRMLVLSLFWIIGVSVLGVGVVIASVLSV